MKNIVKSLIFATLVAIIASCSNGDSTARKLEVAESSVEVWFDTQEYVVEVDATHDWSATTDCEWITVVTSEGKVGEPLRLSFAVNGDDVAREGSVLIESSGAQLSTTVFVKQHKKLDAWMQVTYKTTTANVLDIDWSNAFNANVVSNAYSNGEGLVVFDATLTSVGEQAFYENVDLTSITLPESLEVIGGFAFASCGYLTSVNIPQRVRRIETMAFAYCNKLQELIIPESVQEIQESAFCGCSGLKRIAGKFASVDERCLIMNDVLVQFAPNGMQKYVVPEGVVAIEHDAFYESFSLREVTIPSSVKRIGDYAFYYCESLKSVYCKSTTPPRLGAAVFDNFDGEGDTPIGCNIYVPAESVEAYKSASDWSRYAKYICAETTNE